MKIVVLKFGGTSVGTVERIKKVANIIVGYVRKKFRVIVVSSAMSGVTNNLIKKSKNISDSFNSSEYDVLVAAGEQMSCALIAGRLNHIGYKSQSWMSWQIPILTEGEHTNARIINISVKKINDYLGPSITSKNLRTWLCNVEYIKYILQNKKKYDGVMNNDEIVTKSTKDVSESLHNTASVCKSSYIHPGITKSFLLSFFANKNIHWKVSKIYV